MKSTKSVIVLGVVALAVTGALVMRSAGSADQPESPMPAAQPSDSAPTFVELGSDRCTSCRAMIPVLEELRASHGCKLNVRFIDVWDNPHEGERFGVSPTIPTQVLLGPDGRELARHTGFWSADAIRAAFASQVFALAVSDKGDCGS